MLQSKGVEKSQTWLSDWTELMLKLKHQYFGHLMQRTTHWKRLWCREGLGAGGEGDDRGWDGWTASLTRWTWVWVNSGSWWWTGRPGVRRFMESRRVGHDWATDLIWSDHNAYCYTICFWPLTMSWIYFSTSVSIYNQLQQLRGIPLHGINYRWLPIFCYSKQPCDPQCWNNHKAKHYLLCCLISVPTPESLACPYCK